jgi:hypothetical protein
MEKKKRGGGEREGEEEKEKGRRRRKSKRLSCLLCQPVGILSVLQNSACISFTTRSSLDYLSPASSSCIFHHTVCTDFNVTYA